MAQQHIYDNNGIKMRYATFGEGKEIFVFVPGISLKGVSPLADAIESRYVCDISRDRFKFYVFDQRDKPPVGYSIKDMADDLSQVMDDLGLDAVNMFGVSMGGMVAMAMAAYHPEHVGKLCLTSTAVTIPSSFKKVLPDWIRLSSEHKIKELSEFLVDQIYSPATLKQYRDVIISGCLDATTEEMDSFSIRSRAILNWDICKDVNKIKIPVLVIGSRGDTMLGYECAVRNGELLGCETYLYGEEYAHAVYDEAPDFARRVLKFFINHN